MSNKSSLFLTKQPKEFCTHSSEQTKALAGKILPLFAWAGQKDKSLVLALQGELGAGKTTFVQGLAKALGIKNRITSPTFVLMKKFSFCCLTHCPNLKDKNIKWKNLYHFDCYRIEQPQEILALGWESIIGQNTNIIAIEWPEKIKPLLPSHTIFLKFIMPNEHCRKIVWQIPSLRSQITKNTKAEHKKPIKKYDP